jgi:riboflavin kinase/FMN adenylyltransferase
MLLTDAQKNEMLKEMGFRVKELDYDEVHNFSPEDYLSGLFKELNVAVAVCGLNHRFGKNGSGDAALLKAYCEANGVEAVICPDLMIDGCEVSSSRIRELLKNGEIELANKLLGRPFSFKAEVIHGEQRGRTIGFPTANQLPDERLVVPKFGVYATAVVVNGRQYAGVTNIGIRPMFELKKPQSETYICDFSDDIYGEIIEIKLLKYLREEGHFGSLEGLKSAISSNVCQAKQIIKEIEI